MGTQFHLEGSPASSLKKLDRFFRPRPPITMKMFLVLALVAAVCAEPEADPQLLLHTPYVKPVVPVVDATHYTAGVQKFSNGAVVPEDTMSVKLAKAQHFQAKAVEYMKKPYMVAPVVYKAPIAPVAPLAHHTYAPYTYPYAAHHVFKREAESEADSQVLYNTPYTAGVLPYTYKAGVLPYTVYNAGVVPKVYSGVYPTTSYTYPYVY